MDLLPTKFSLPIVCIFRVCSLAPDSVTLTWDQSARSPGPASYPESANTCYWPAQASHGLALQPVFHHPHQDRGWVEITWGLGNILEFCGQMICCVDTVGSWWRAREQGQGWGWTELSLVWGVQCGEWEAEARSEVREAGAHRDTRPRHQASVLQRPSASGGSGDTGSRGQRAHKISIHW